MFMQDINEGVLFFEDPDNLGPVVIFENNLDVIMRRIFDCFSICVTQEINYIPICYVDDSLLCEFTIEDFEPDNLLKYFESIEDYEICNEIKILTNRINPID